MTWASPSRGIVETRGIGGWCSMLSNCDRVRLQDYHVLASVVWSADGFMPVRYWIKPENEAGRYTGVDFVFQDGSNLRDSAARDLDDRSLHPGQPKGAVGQWTKIESPIGAWLAGSVDLRGLTLERDVPRRCNSLMERESEMKTAISFSCLIWSNELV